MRQRKNGSRRNSIKHQRRPCLALSVTRRTSAVSNQLLIAQLHRVNEAILLKSGKVKLYCFTATMHKWSKAHSKDSTGSFFIITIFADPAPANFHLFCSLSNQLLRHKSGHFLSEAAFALWWFTWAILVSAISYINDPLDPYEMQVVKLLPLNKQQVHFLVRVCPFGIHNQIRKSFSLPLFCFLTQSTAVCGDHYVRQL